MIDLNLTALGFTAFPFIGSFYGARVQKTAMGENGWYKVAKYHFKSM